jgi:hypothetical protein
LIDVNSMSGPRHAAGGPDRPIRAGNERGSAAPTVPRGGSRPDAGHAVRERPMDRTAGSNGGM